MDQAIKYMSHNETINTKLIIKLFLMIKQNKINKNYKNKYKNSKIITKYKSICSSNNKENIYNYCYKPNTITLADFIPEILISY